MKRNSQVGFTIVELLIVVVVIAILAAITIISYNGIRARAEASALKSDITTSFKTLEVARNSKNGTYDAVVLAPYINASNNGVTTNFRYATNTSVCLEATNQSGLTYYIDTSTSSTPKEGTCPALTNAEVDPRCIAGKMYVVAQQLNYTNESLSMSFTTSTSGSSSATTIAPGANKTGSVTNHATSIANGVATFQLTGLSGSTFSAVHLYPYSGESC